MQMYPTELQRIIDHWEEECMVNPDSVRYHFLKKMLSKPQFVRIPTEIRSARQLL
jgi:hypothetical protein